MEKKNSSRARRASEANVCAEQQTFLSHHPTNDEPLPMNRCWLEKVSWAIEGFFEFSCFATGCIMSGGKASLQVKFGKFRTVLHTRDEQILLYYGYRYALRLNFILFCSFISCLTSTLDAGTNCIVIEVSSIEYRLSSMLDSGIDSLKRL